MNVLNMNKDQKGLSHKGKCKKLLRRLERKAEAETGACRGENEFPPFLTT